MRSWSFLFLLLGLSACDRIWANNITPLDLGTSGANDLAMPPPPIDGAVPPSDGSAGGSTDMAIAFPQTMNDSPGSGGTWYGVWAGSLTNVFITGASGNIIQRQSPKVWKVLTSPTNADLFAISGTVNAGTPTAWAVGVGGAIVRIVGPNLANQTANTGKNLNGVWAASETTALAVGDLGTVVATSDGANWGAKPLLDKSSNPFALAANLRAVWGIGTSLFVVGDNGTVLVSMNGGAQWQQVTGLPPENYNAVWGVDASHVWVAGTATRMLAFDGTTWVASQQLASMASIALHAVWGKDSSLVLAVGDSGTVIGTRTPFAPSLLGSLGGVTLNGMSGLPKGAAWIVGSGDTIMMLP